MAHARACGAFAVGMDVDHAFDGRGNFEDGVFGAFSAVTSAGAAGYRRRAGLPFIVKGVLSVTDAVEKRGRGRGGPDDLPPPRIQDYAVPPLMILPEIALAVGARTELFLSTATSSAARTYSRRWRWAPGRWASAGR